MADVPSTLLQWSTTASSNSPAGSTSVGSGLDDNLRELQAVIANYLQSYNASAIASSGTCAIGAHSGLFIEISGTTTITSFGTPTTGSNWKIVRFQGALTLTHNATSMILPFDGLNRVTEAGDYLLAFHRGSGNWTVPFYSRASGYPNTLFTSLPTSTTATSDDLIIIADGSTGVHSKVTIADALEAINGLTEDASPVISTDYLLTYDASAGAAKKALLSAFAATTSVAGVAELALAAEVLAGSDATRIVTPASFYGNFSGTSAAWTYGFPGGFYIKGGGGAYADNAGAGTSYAFNSVFPTAFWGVVCGYTSGSASHYGPRVIGTAVSGITVTLNPGAAGAGTVWYLAWGN